MAAVDGADLVIARLPSEIGMFALDLAAQLGRPTIAEVVACVWDGLRRHGSLAGPIYAPLAYWRMRRAVRRASATSFVTKGFLQTRYPAGGYEMAVSDVEITPAPRSVIAARRSRVVDQRAIHFGMIAPLFHKEKGIDVAIKALAIARQTEPQLTLSVLGPGEPEVWERTARSYNIINAIRFCGSLPRGEPVLRWLDGIDVYLQASFQEGLPRSLIEAMSRGCPVLASDAGGTNELLRDDFLHQPGDFKRLARQMLAIRNATALGTMIEENYSTSLQYSKNLLDARRERQWAEIIDRYGLPSAGLERSTT